ncbi:phosphoglycerol transferase MdoB-like AlkP superfamily enzyme [Paenibacillus phyllosphaerae]|uniref:Phosphoglycerol transferase MdoB-like AlkP superfamily enzyme n=1 Tax=Paenibacillus phyllosphaerae TaxID=274593 RepID=A0A7W5FN54_9BACL|nr:LTA synthase family protein [Paenibacillus phyllosphaerae]MBB3110699.1 phosphoglycerol transferase MdoB-like AlkP superfamily enzyme [Paenibacillus phyllosphaerae]
MSLSTTNRLISARPFIFFTIILLIKSYIAWFVLFDTVPVWQPLVTEMPFFWLAFCLLEWFASKRKLAYYIGLNLLFTSIFFAVIMYYKYYGVIVTYHALEQVNQVTAVKDSVFELLDPYFLFIFTDIIVLMILPYRSKNKQLWKMLSARKVNRSVVMALFVVSFAIVMLNVWPNRASMNEIKKAEEMGILSYEAYTMLDWSEKPLVQADQITQAKINEMKGITEPVKAKLFGTAEGRNVIVIQMEAFQSFLIGLKIDGQEVTPNLNKLAKDNFYFPHFFQQVGQGNTSDAEFVVNTSFYIPPNGAATMRYADKVLPSMPRLFEANGYESLTFHTNDASFWNRKNLYDALGFTQYYDKSFFGEEDKVFFGASDEVLYRKTTEELKKKQEAGIPFYAQLITMTSHHPFSIPEEKDKIKLPERFQDTFVGDYIRAQSYTDYALGQFIEELKASGLWENSVIVLYGDHLGLPIYSLDSDDEQLMAEIYDREYTYTDMINIPLIIASPGITYPSQQQQIGGQGDIMPTIMNLAGISLQDHIHFGQDLLNQTKYNLLPQRYYLPSGSFVSGQTLYMPGTAFKDGVEYPLAGNGKRAVDEVTETEYNNALNLLHYSDSYVNQLPNRE